MNEKAQDFQGYQACLERAAKLSENIANEVHKYGGQELTIIIAAAIQMRSRYGWICSFISQSPFGSYYLPTFLECSFFHRAWCRLRNKSIL